MALLLLASGDSLAGHSYLKGSKRLLIELLFLRRLVAAEMQQNLSRVSLGEMLKL